MWINKIPQIPEYICSDRKLAVQKNFYQEAVKSHDFEVLIGIVKGLYQKGHRLQNIKKPLTSIEEQFKKTAENLVHQEFAAALEIDASEVAEYIKNTIEN